MYQAVSMRVTLRPGKGTSYQRTLTLDPVTYATEEI